MDVNELATRLRNRTVTQLELSAIADLLIDMDRTIKDRDAKIAAMYSNIRME